MTTKESAQILAVLTAAYPNAYKNMTPKEAAAVALVWAAQFADVSYDIVFMALQKTISTCKFPPTVCEVKDKIGSLYWEAREGIQWHQMGYHTLTAEELAAYEQISECTEPYRNNHAEPRLKDLLSHSRQMLTSGETANK